MLAKKKKTHNKPVIREENRDKDIEYANKLNLNLIRKSKYVYYIYMQI